jgi:hypothetical protein
MLELLRSGNSISSRFKGEFMILEECTKIMHDVRGVYADGRKSSNKRYYVTRSGARDDKSIDASTDKEKAIERYGKRSENFVNETERMRPKRDLSKSLLDFGEEIHLAEEVAPPAGNCFEMTALSGYLAKTSYQTDPEYIYEASIARPADHSFCLVTDLRLSDQELEKYDELSKLVEDNRAVNWFVIDPWLHVACKANDYLAKAKGQLQIWGGKGKRIKWNGKQGPGWYPPIGEYEEAFVGSSIALRRFVK